MIILLDFTTSRFGHGSTLVFDWVRLGQSFFYFFKPERVQALRRLGLRLTR
jgi:hypothetical protein